MIRHLVQRLPGGKGLAVVLVAAALALGGLSVSSVHAPAASAQCFGLTCSGYPYYNNYSYGYPFGYNAYNYYNYGYPNYNNYYNYSYPYYNSYYNYSYPYYNNYYNYSYRYPYYNNYYNYSYGYPYYNNYNYGTYMYPYSSYYTSAYTPTTTYVAPTTTYTPSGVVASPGGPAYMTAGSYCTVGSEQIWVPAGASPAAYGCTGTGS